jgi:hypothetical protein
MKPYDDGDEGHEGCKREVGGSEMKVFGLASEDTVYEGDYTCCEKGDMVERWSNEGGHG